jgi:hypothetical protein
MLDSQTYNQNQEIAKINIANWRKSNIHIPYYFQIQNFPIEINFSEGLTQLLDTMQEGRFDKYMNEIGGFTDEDLTKIFDSVKKNSTFIEGGLTGRRIRRLNIDDWKDQDLANKLSLNMI